LVTVLVDSSVLIGYTRGSSASRQLLDIDSPSSRLVIHLVCAAEVLQGARDQNELATLQEFLGGFRTLRPTDEDLLASMIMLKAHRLRDGVDWHDCIIAATALRLGCTRRDPQCQALPLLQGACHDHRGMNIALQPAAP
jgi:predicted nucleic acid-binding protein